MEQLHLFETGAAACELDRWQQQRAAFTQHIRAYNTTRTFQNGWKSFVNWCLHAGYRPLPATSDTIALYVTALLDGGSRIATARVYLNSIVYMHRTQDYSPPCCTEARLILEGAQRLRKETPLARTAICIDELRRICLKFDPEYPRDVRDHALLVVGFASALRRSNLAALDLEDIAFTRAGLLIVIRSEKTDQEGRGRSIGLPEGTNAETCPVRTLHAWLRLRGTTAGGPLFQPVMQGGHIRRTRMAQVAVLRAVKRAVARIGLDPARYGAHSLRAGMITTALEAGANEAVIRKTSGHRSIQALHQYYRPRDAFGGNLGRLLGI